MSDIAERRLSEAGPRTSTRTPESPRTQADSLRAFESWKYRKLAAVGRDQRLVTVGADSLGACGRGWSAGAAERSAEAFLRPRTLA